MSDEPEEIPNEQCPYCDDVRKSRDRWCHKCLRIKVFSPMKPLKRFTKKKDT